MQLPVYLQQIFAAAAIILLTGCSTIVAPPAVHVRSITPVGVTLSGIDFEADLQVSNPNRFDLSLLSYSYSLLVANRQLSSASVSQITTFPAHQKAGIKLPISVRYSDLFALIQQQPDPEQLPYHLKAALEMETPLGKSIIPINRTGTFSLPESYHQNPLLQRFKELFKPL